MVQHLRRLSNSFLFRIVLVVLGGMLLGLTLGDLIVLNFSRQAFIINYGQSQEKVFERITEEFEDLNETLENVAAAVDSSWAFRLYLSGEETDNLQNYRNIYQMEEDLSASLPTDRQYLNILVLGRGGRHFLTRTETIAEQDEEIWNSAPVRKALEEPDIYHFFYTHDGFTATAAGTHSLLAVRALPYKESHEVYGVLIITIPCQDLQTYYDYFLTANSAFFLISEDGTILSTGDDSLIGRPMEEDWYQEARERKKGRFVTAGSQSTVLCRELPYMKAGIYGIVDNAGALESEFDLPLLAGIIALVTLLFAMLCAWLTHRLTVPMTELNKKMSVARETGFEEYMPEAGMEEVRETAHTYNAMLDDIRRYIEQLLKTQKQKRKSEIRALQMQINPHYIYNTLASIKFLVFQGDADRAAHVIDAFIALLRSTISESSEYVSVDKEVENLKNYILINQTRYGDAVQVEFYISDNCRNCLLPKMSLQPFLENAFFHAFPSGGHGTIQIFMRKKQDALEIRIADDGIGMSEEELEKLGGEGMGPKEHFSGIGVRNVKERLHLLYGKEWGVTIESRKGEGTSVLVRIPAQEPGEEEQNGRQV